MVQALLRADVGDQIGLDAARLLLLPQRSPRRPLLISARRPDLRFSLRAGVRLHVGLVCIIRWLSLGLIGPRRGSAAAS